MFIEKPERVTRVTFFSAAFPPTSTANILPSDFFLRAASFAAPAKFRPNYRPDFISGVITVACHFYSFVCFTRSPFTQSLPIDERRAARAATSAICPRAPVLAYYDLALLRAPFIIKARCVFDVR
jgi:hypothetical protein